MNHTKNYLTRTAFTFFALCIILTGCDRMEKGPDEPVLTGYKKTYTTNTSGQITQMLQSGDDTYAFMVVDGEYRMYRVNDAVETWVPFSGTITPNQMVSDLDGGILLAGTVGIPYRAGLTKLNSNMNFVFEKVYSLLNDSEGHCVVPKNTNAFPGYIVGGLYRNNQGSFEANLINTTEDGTLYFHEVADFNHRTGRIFRNTDNGSNSYVTFGEWYDPFSQKRDVVVSTVNENGVDYFPTTQYIGLNNGHDDVVFDVAQYDGSSFAGVGYINGSPSFFTIRYTDLNFSQPQLVTGFSNLNLVLKSVCVLAGNQGFAVCGMESDPTVFGNIWPFIAKIDNNGNIVWKKRLDGRGTANAITATPDGGMMVGGQEYCANFPQSACNFPVLYKLDGNGDYQ